jgi:hypothetical protein
MAENTNMPLRFILSRRALLVIGAGIVMAFISARFLFNGSILNVVPWGILAFATAFVAANKRQSLILGAIFGFVVSYAFLWFDNSGSKTLSSVLILIPVVVAPALFGALCGLTMAWLGWTLRQVFSK